MTINVGDLAPDFSLTNQHGETVTLSAFRGKKAVTLVFTHFRFREPAPESCVNFVTT